MQFQLFLQFIIPLTFLAIWALTSLLNRDAQPMPPRPGVGRGPGGGPQPGGGGFSPSARGEALAAGRATGAGSGRTVERTGPGRWATTTTTTTSRTTGGSGRGDDGITILESQTRPVAGSGSTSGFSPSSSAANPRVARGLGARRAAARGRAASTPPTRPAERERTRSLTGLAGESLGPKQGKALEIAPLASPIASIASSLSSVSQSSTSPEARDARPSRPTLSADDLRPMLASPGKLREAALLAELLQPPVALRPSRRKI